jgi:hypothetical protein
MFTKALSFGWVALVGVAIPALAAVPARPGTINFIEGKVLVDGQDVTSQSNGSASVPVGSVLRTQSGKAEVLLSPGIFLRLDSNSEVRMDAAGLLDTRITINRGAAMLEASDLKKENNIQIASAGLNAAIKDEGLYRFDTQTGYVAVFDGKAEVREGDEKVEIKKGKTVAASGDNAELKVEKFDVKEAKKTDELYQWSSLRSKYLADASEATARRVIVQPGLWAGSGWYWNPYFGTYSWLPSRGSYFSPFGYGFYSPFYYSRPRYIVPRYRVGPRPGYGVQPMTPRHPRMGVGRGPRR